MKYSFLLLFTLLQVSVFAQTKGPGLTFKETYHDFGDMKQGAIVEHTFELTNTGDSTLLLQKVYSTCGCTVPTWPKEGIEPGKSAQITVKFNSEGKMGISNKVITVLSNAKNTPPDVPTRLSIRANILPK